MTNEKLLFVMGKVYDITTLCGVWVTPRSVIGKIDPMLENLHTQEKKWWHEDRDQKHAYKIKAPRYDVQ